MAKATRAVSSIDVARYYLKSEFGHIFPGQAEELYPAIDRFHDSKVWRLTEALSTFYRLNGVWWVINNPNFSWTLETVSIDRIVLTGVGDNPLSNLIRSEKINREPAKLRSYLKDYYSKFPEDPKGYDVQPTNRPIELESVMLAEVKDGLRLIDGSHRFIELLQAGINEVKAYVARPKLPMEKITPSGGRGTIWLLDKLVDNHPEQIIHIKEVAKLLARESMFREEFNRIMNQDSSHE